MQKKANVFDLEENKQQPREEKQLNEKKKHSLQEFFEDVKLFTSLLGYKIFDIPNSKEEHIFYSKNKKGTYARGLNKSKKALKEIISLQGSEPKTPSRKKKHVFYCESKKKVLMQGGGVITVKIKNLLFLRGQKYVKKQPLLIGVKIEHFV